MPSDAELLDRALTYPYDRLRSSAVLIGERVLAMLRVDMSDPGGCEVVDGTTVTNLAGWCRAAGVDIPTADRDLLLAYGANASPARLQAKLGPLTDQAVIAVKAELADFDVVYSAHVARYGSVPATIQRSPGTRVGVHVLAVTAEQHSVLRRSEGNYLSASLESISLQVHGGPSLSGITAFVSRHGVLKVDASPVALSDVAATRRRFGALVQAQVQERVRDMVAPGVGMAEFVLQNVADPELAARRSAVLAEQALAFAAPAWRVLTP